MSDEAAGSLAPIKGAKRTRRKRQTDSSSLPMASANSSSVDAGNSQPLADDPAPSDAPVPPQEQKQVDSNGDNADTQSVQSSASAAKRRRRRRGGEDSSSDVGSVAGSAENPAAPGQDQQDNPENDAKEPNSGMASRAHLEKIDELPAADVEEDDLLDEKDHPDLHITHATIPETVPAAVNSTQVFAEGRSDFRKVDEGEDDEQNGGAQVTLATSTIEEMSHYFQGIMASVFVFCQGLLAGVGLTFLLVFSTTSRQDLLAALSPMSVPLERVFFFLGTMSTAGAAEKAFKDSLSGWLLKDYKKFVDWLSLFLYMLCVVFCVLAAPVDEIIYFSHKRTPLWFTLPMPSEFVSMYDRWVIYNWLRCFIAIFAWSLQSLETWTFLPDGPNGVLQRLSEIAASSKSFGSRIHSV